MKITIRLTLATALVSAAAIGFGVPASRASTFGHSPWCAVVDQGGNIMWDCLYESAAECAPNVVAGNRGFCQHNPYYRPEPPQDAEAVQPPGAATRWRYIGNGNYVGE